MIRILWTQKQDAGPGTVRDYAAMSFDSDRGRTVLFGGSGASGPLGDTWEWDGVNWTQMADSGPPARFQSAMAYDAQRKQTVLFSGANSLLDTWGWDGNNWTQMADSGAPGRGEFAMAYDSKRQQTLIFGGTGGLGDTWAWNGVAWTQLAETGPAPRSAHSMAYDSSRDRTVLFGGMGLSSILGDTWEWNGSAWTRVSDFGPVPCYYAALAFKGDSVALFGGATGSFTASVPITPGSTWTWDGSHWTLRQDFGPQPRFGHAMSYDSKRGTLVLFGGGVSHNTSVVDTWEHSEGP